MRRCIWPKVTRRNDKAGTAAPAAFFVYTSNVRVCSGVL